MTPIPPTRKVCSPCTTQSTSKPGWHARAGNRCRVSSQQRPWRQKDTSPTRSLMFMVSLVPRAICMRRSMLQVRGSETYGDGLVTLSFVSMIGVPLFQMVPVDVFTLREFSLEKK
ncbi:hypothetical protein PspLS_12134 [Pyricularia sp. CBS 133598]|nr:hypothetical protein PspLS_12134 [Pyricularia sp. CBS 133598]